MPRNLTFEYDAEKKQVTVSADCPVGATSSKAYKDHANSGAAYIVDDKITKTFSNIEDGVSHLYGLSALYDDIESTITEEEFTPIIETKILTVDEYIPGKSSWITGTHQGTLAKKVGIYINGGRVYPVPIDAATPGQFKYWKNDIKITDTLQVYLADADENELVRADVPISADNTNEEE